MQHRLSQFDKVKLVLNHIGPRIQTKERFLTTL